MTQQRLKALDAMLRGGPLDLGGDVTEQRSLFAEMMSHLPQPGDVSITHRALAGVPVTDVHPPRFEQAPAPTAADAVILYLHGGAYAIGSADLAVPLAAELVRRTGAAAVAVDYRLAPEHPYPAALQDTLAVYRALLDAGTPSDSIVFAGESAGGGLAVAALLAARQAGLPGPGLLGVTPAAK